MADALRRWAYPTSQAGDDVSMHGTLQDAEEMEEIPAKEKKGGKGLQEGDHQHGGGRIAAAIFDDGTRVWAGLCRGRAKGGTGNEVDSSNWRKDL